MLDHGNSKYKRDFTSNVFSAWCPSSCCESTVLRHNASKSPHYFTQCKQINKSTSRNSDYKWRIIFDSTDSLTVIIWIYLWTKTHYKDNSGQKSKYTGCFLTISPWFLPPLPLIQCWTMGGGRILKNEPLSSSNEWWWRHCEFSGCSPHTFDQDCRLRMMKCWPFIRTKENSVLWVSEITQDCLKSLPICLEISFWLPKLFIVKVSK